MSEIVIRMGKLSPQLVPPGVYLKVTIWNVHALADMLNADLIHSAWEDGIEEGRRLERKEQPQPELIDDDMPPSLHEMAKFCAMRGQRMPEKQRGFIKNMVAWTANGGTISEEQELYFSYLYNDLRRKR